MSNIRGQIGTKIEGIVSSKQKSKIEKLSKEMNLPVKRLVAIAIYKELKKDKPFEFSFDMPTDEYVENAFANEGQKILDFLDNKRNGQSLDFMALLHDDLDIDAIEIFMLGFAECLAKNRLIIHDIVEEDKSRYPIGTIVYSVDKSTKKKLLSSKTVMRRAKKLEKEEAAEKLLRKSRPELFK